MAELEGRTILVTRAAGDVGWGVARAARDAGARLVLPARSAEGVERLAAEFDGEARILRADVATDDGLTTVLRDMGAGGSRLDHVVAPIGSWWHEEPALDQDPDELEELLDAYAEAQFRIVEATAPLLRASAGSYTVVTGAAGEAPHVAGSGLLAAAVKAQLGLAEVLKAEHEGDGFRVNEFRIAARVEREPRPGVVPAAEVGRVLLGVLTGGARGETIRYPEE